MNIFYVSSFTFYLSQQVADLHFSQKNSQICNTTGNYCKYLNQMHTYHFRNWLNV